MTEFLTHTLLRQLLASACTYVSHVPQRCPSLACVRANVDIRELLPSGSEGGIVIRTRLLHLASGALPRPRPLAVELGEAKMRRSLTLMCHACF